MYQKPCAYKEYPKSVYPEGTSGKQVIVHNAEEEAEVTGTALEEVLEKNEANAMTPVEKLKRADEILQEAKAIRERALEEAEGRGGNTDAPEEEKGPEVKAGLETGSEDGASGTDGATKAIESSADVPEGDKNALEAYAKEKFGIDIDKRKSFADLLELVKQEEAKAA